MSNPHYIRILVTHQPTYELLENAETATQN